MIPHDRARQLAALACCESTTEAERTSAAKKLAELVHKTPELFAAPASPAPLPGVELDPLVGAMVREGFGMMGGLFRDMFGRRDEVRCPACGVLTVPTMRAGVPQWHCPRGHGSFVKDPPKPSPPTPAAAPRPGPRKARAARTRRA